jgi:hypothetical protein
MQETIVTPQDFPEIRWLGHWIWVPEEPIVPGGGFAASLDPQAKEAHGLFRKKFTLKQVPGGGPPPRAPPGPARAPPRGGG